MGERTNLIQQLQATPKWKEFEEWYDEQKYYTVQISGNPDICFEKLTSNLIYGDDYKYKVGFNCLPTFQVDKESIINIQLP